MKIKFKGTKGKWEVCKTYQTITDQKGFGIAQENGIRNSNEWTANALLISKAPELLEVLGNIIKGYEQAPGEMWIPDYISEHITKAKQLIKEATEL